MLPVGFEMPPLAVLLSLTFGTLIVGSLLVVMRPPFRSWDVMAFIPWMVFGSTLHVLEVTGTFPESVAPAFAAPAVYLTTFIVAGAIWLLAEFGDMAGLITSIPRFLGTAGGATAFIVLVFALFRAAELKQLTMFWPVIGIGVTLLIGAIAVIVLSLVYTDAVAVTGKTGGFVIFAHVADGVSTAIGIDVLGVGEQSPLPRLILGTARDLPLAGTIGTGWLFVLIKIALAMLIVATFTDYVKERPERGNLLLASVAAVGFGPGIYNLLLFAVGP